MEAIMRRKISQSILFVLVYIWGWQHTETLRNVQIVASEAVRVGDSIRLVCEYDLENVALYSIKWYFNDNEFYRFVPKESPPTRVFPVPGIQVDMSKSDNKSVLLQSMEKDLTGFYKCEVSADAPLFHTDIQKTLVVVTVKPESLPTMQVDKRKYSEGEIIRANCTSRKGFPAANLTWFINSKKITSTGLRTVKPVTTTVSNDYGGMETSKSGLEVLATSELFPNGKLTLGCEATQFGLYRKRVELSLAEDAPQLAHVLSPARSNYGWKLLPDWRLHSITFGMYYFAGR